MFLYNDKEYRCPMEMTIDLIGGKWKALILWHLSTGTKRFNELRKMFPDVTQKMLTQQLRDLERDGLIMRKVYPQVPPKVEYKLSDFGSTLMPVLQTMNSWGTGYMDSKKQEAEV